MLRTLKLHICSMTLIILSTSVYADTTSKVVFTSTETVTGVSGYSGGYKQLERTGDYGGLSGISWWENTDDPCKLTLQTHHLNLFGLLEHTALIGNCSTPGNPKDVWVAGNEDNIYKVQVCTTDKTRSNKDKMKGVRFWARSITYTNPLKLTSQATAQEAKHTNCATWHKAVECPNGQVASALRVHYNLLNDITGLALVCRTVINK